MLNFEQTNNSHKDEELKDLRKETPSFTKGVKHLGERNPREQFQIQSRGGKLSHQRRAGKKLAHEFDSVSARAAALKRWGK